MKKFLLLASLSFSLVAGIAVAEEPSSPTDGEKTAAEERSTAFRAVSGPETESVPGGALLVGAYIVLWALVLGYLLRLGTLARGVAADASALREEMERVSDDVR